MILWTISATIMILLFACFCVAVVQRNRAEQECSRLHRMLMDQTDNWLKSLNGETPTCEEVRK